MELGFKRKLDGLIFFPVIVYYATAYIFVVRRKITILRRTCAKTADVWPKKPIFMYFFETIRLHLFDTFICNQLIQNNQLYYIKRSSKHMIKKILKKLRMKRSMKRSLKELKKNGFITDSNTANDKVFITFSDEVQNSMKEFKVLQK